MTHTHKASILRDTRPATHQTRFRINRFDPMVIFSCSDSGFPATSSALGQVTTVIMTVFGADVLIADTPIVCPLAKPHPA